MTEPPRPLVDTADPEVSAAPQQALGKKAFQAVGWVGFQRGGQLFAGFLVQLVLARLLAPEDFGLIALLLVFIELGKRFVEAGFGSAIVQKTDVSQVDLSTVFFFNVLAGLGLAGLLCALAPSVAAFYDQPLLRPLLRVLSLSLVVGSLSPVHSALLTRRVDFKSMARVGLPATFLAGAFGVWLALEGFGVWALVAQRLAKTTLTNAFLWRRSKWIPSWTFDARSLGRMLPFGSRLFLASLIDTFFRNVYFLVIGKVFTVADLGFYQRARNLQKLPTTLATQSVGTVVFPLFSGIKDDDARLRRGIRKTLTTVAFLHFPAMAGIGLVARPLIEVLLTEKWLPSVPYLQLFCVVGALYPIHAANLNLLKAKGHSEIILRLEVVKKLLVTISILLTYRYGVLWMLIGQVAISMLALPINAHYTRKLIGYSLWDQVRDLAPILGATLVMASSVYFLGRIVTLGPTPLLVLQAAAGATLYAGLSKLLRLQGGEQLGSLLRKRSRR